jgi:RimJ/RimL family protein N-acetyltransferase
MAAVRRLRIGEAQLFREMRLRSLREAPYAFTSTYESAQLRTSESWAEQADSTVQGSDRSTFIAFSGESPIGIAALYRTGEGSDVGALLQVWVAPEHRGQGAAVELMDAVFDWAAENGFRTVLARVAETNARALRFYQKYGFELTGRASLSNSVKAFVLTKEARLDY